MFPWPYTILVWPVSWLCLSSMITPTPMSKQYSRNKINKKAKPQWASKNEYWSHHHECAMILIEITITCQIKFGTRWVFSGNALWAKMQYFSQLHPWNKKSAFLSENVWILQYITICEYYLPMIIQVLYLLYTKYQNMIWTPPFHKTFRC